ncbi:MAG: hypothetical protein JXO44_06065 [Clostridia bacterium]|nr:hypothetical protein [Clostridia bacterium]
MICPKCQAKFNGFRMGKDRDQHIIKCGNCDSFLIPTEASFQKLKKDKAKYALSLLIVATLLLAYATRVMSCMSDWYYFLVIIITAIIASKFYVSLYKKSYAKTIKFEVHDVYFIK